MIVKMVDGGPRGLTLMVCDDDGQPLPNQCAVQLTQRVGDIPVVTVEFLIDAKRVRLER